MKTDNLDQLTDQFKTRKDALDWLIAEGYKISQGKFYSDAGVGKVVVNRDGTLSKWAVYQYAKEELKTGTVSAAPDGSLAAEQLRKVRAEADLKELQFQLATRQRDKFWLHADDAWATMAAIVGTLRDSIRHHLHARAREIVFLTGGDQGRSHEVFERLDEIVSMAYNEVGGGSIDVEFERAVEDTSEVDFSGQVS
jgi:hypothetical protein